MGSQRLIFKRKIKAHDTLDSLLWNQELMLCDKARVKWLKDGNCYSNFSHSLLQSRKTNEPLTSLYTNGMVNTDHKGIQTHFIDFYQQLLFEDSNSFRTD